MSKEDDYRRLFGLDSPPEIDDLPRTVAPLRRAERALEHALDIRKFEIGLYWQRTAYFWALIAATFAGYIAVQNSDHVGADKRFFAYVVSCIGLVFTWAWFLVNRGSKLWQENWEDHVDMA